MKKIVLFSIFLLLIGLTNCRLQDEAKQNITSLKFNESARNLSIGDVINVNIIATPVEGKNNNTIEYSVSDNEVIEIQEGSSNDGIIIKAIGRGSAVVTASVNGINDYLNIIVSGTSTITIPHIVLPYNVIEIPANERRNITVSLAGGSEMDNSNFGWSNSNNETVQFNYAGNVGIIDGLKPGESVIKVNHPKAQYPINILVFVLGANQNPLYITSKDNIITMNANDAKREFQVELKNGTDDDNSGFVYSIVQGNDIIELNGYQKKGTILPKKAGVAIIEIDHVKTNYPLQIQVIVNENIDYKYIEVSRNLLIFNTDNSQIFEATFVGEAPNDVNNKFKYSIQNENICSVVNSQGVFYVYPLAKGKTVITIENEYVNFKREILVIVNKGENILKNEKYIWTSQNLITMEKNGLNTTLNMVLVNGNEADKDMFEWIIEDNHVIDIEPVYGNWREDNKNNSVFSRTMISEDEYLKDFMATALIIPKNVGTSRIMLRHEKSENNCVVVVKVYPVNTFGNVPVVLSGSPYYEVVKGKNRDVNLMIASGSINDAVNLDWEIQDNDIVDVVGTSLNAVLKGGVKSGYSNMEVKGEYLKYPFRSIVINREEDEVLGKFIYVLNPFITAARGTQVYQRIYGMGLEENDLKNLNINITSSSKDKEIIRCNYFNGDIVFDILETGSSEVRISGNGLNEILITIFVEEEKVNPSKPFYITSDKEIIGLSKNGTKNKYDLFVNLVGASQKHYDDLIYTSLNNNIVTVSGAGKSCIITAKNEGQTVIRVKHEKSINDLDIVVYVVNDDNELNNKVFLLTEKTNYMLEVGDLQLINISSNADQGKLDNITWGVDIDDIIDINVSSDMLSAFIKPIKTGNVVLSVRHNNNYMPLNIMISVVNKKNSVLSIGLPSIVEAVINNNITVETQASDLSRLNYQELIFKVQDENIANIGRIGKDLNILPKKAGNTIIKAKYEPSGFEKDILLYVYNTANDMYSNYIISVDKNYIKMNKGETRDIQLTFGTNKLPDHEIINLRWVVADSDNKAISVTNNGSKGTIKAERKGTNYLEIYSSNNITNKIIIEVEVDEGEVINGEYYIDINNNDKIKKIVTGSYSEMYVNIFNGNNEITVNNGDITYEIETQGIVQIFNSSNYFRITGLKEGQTSINFKYSVLNSVLEEKIIVYVGSQNKLDNIYAIFVEENNYLIRKNESINIKIETEDNNFINLNKILYEKASNKNIISISEISKKEIKVLGLEKGNETINIKFNGEIVNKLYISVTETSSTALSVFMQTENIIGIVRGQEYLASVYTNLEDYNLKDIRWYSEDENIVSVGIDNSGDKQVLKANNVGNTFVSVRYGSVERFIYVYVRNTKYEVDNYEVLNTDNRNYIIEKGQGITLNISNNKNTIKGNTIFTDYYNSNFNNVIEIVSNDNKSVNLKGLNEGIAVIKVKNDLYPDTNILIYVEVLTGGLYGTSGVSNNSRYITSRNTLFVLEPYEEECWAEVSVMGSDFYYNSYYSWYGYNGNIIEVINYGDRAKIIPKNKGKTVIYVGNPYCDNVLEITVIVGEGSKENGINDKFIFVEKDIYDINVNDPPFTVYYELRNGDIKNSIIDMRLFGNSIQAINLDIADLEMGRIQVTPKYTGQSIIELVIDDLTYSIYFMVRNTVTTGAVFLTTSNNVVLTGKNVVQTVDIRLINFVEMDSSKFVWGIEDKTIAQVIGNGTRAQIYPERLGETRFWVRHENATNNEENKLYMNLRVVEDYIKEKAVYLTTNTNVIETVVNETLNYVSVEKIGGNINVVDAIWKTDDPTVITLTGNNFKGSFIAKKAGITRITVTNSECSSPIEIIVIIKEPSNTDCFIDTFSKLLTLTPGETNHRVQVQLVNGSEKDNDRFLWSVYYQVPTDTKISEMGGNVVSLNTIGNVCYINAINEGTAKIRVAHDKSDSPLYIVVYVTKYLNVSFKEQQKEMVENTNQFIKLNIPSYENFRGKVIYTSDNPDVCKIIGIGDSAILSAGIPGMAILSARIEGLEAVSEMIINVVYDDPEVFQITTPKTIYVINPRDVPFKIDARIKSVNARDTDNDDLVWILEEKAGDTLQIFPKNGKKASDNDSDYPFDYDARGREIQISPVPLLNNVEFTETVVTIGHKLVSKHYWKTIYIRNSEVADAITLDKVTIAMGDTGTEKLRATIVGGRARDYDQIFWNVIPDTYYDGTLIDVVRVIGEGRDVMLLPVGEGMAIVQAIYNGYVAECLVKVEAQYNIQFVVQNIKLYPGKEVNVKYNMKPSTAMVTPINMGTNAENKQIVSVQNETLIQELKVKAENEGQAQVTLIMSPGNKRTMLNIVVKENYEFVMGKNVQVPPSEANDNFWTEHQYRVYPDDTRLTLRPQQNIPEGFTVEIGQPIKQPSLVDSPSSQDGWGKIYLKTIKEQYDFTLNFEQVKADGSSVSPPNIISLKIISRIGDPDDPESLEQIIPYIPIRKDNGEYEGSGYISSLKNNSFTKEIKNGKTKYVLNIADGDERYILFDKKFGNKSIANFDKPVHSTIDANEKLYDKLNASDIGFVFERVNIEYNGTLQPAIRVSGGHDVTNYNRIAFNKRPLVESTADNVSGGSTKTVTTQVQQWISQINLNEFNGYSNTIENLNLWYLTDKWIKSYDPYYLYNETDINHMINNSNISFTENNEWWYKNSLIDVNLIKENPPINLNIATLEDKYNYNYLEDKTATGVEKIKEIPHFNNETWYLYTEEQFNAIKTYSENKEHLFVLYNSVFGEINNNYKYCSEIAMFNYTKIESNEENVNIIENGVEKIKNIVTYTYETWYLYKEEEVNDIKLFNTNTLNDFKDYINIFEENNNIYKYCSNKYSYDYKKTVNVELNGFLINLPIRVDTYYYNNDEVDYNVNNVFYDENEAPKIIIDGQETINYYYKFNNIINFDTIDEDGYIRTESKFIYTRKKPNLTTINLYVYNIFNSMSDMFEPYLLEENKEEAYIVWKQLKDNNYYKNINSNYIICRNRLYSEVTTIIPDNTASKISTWDILNENPNFRYGASLSFKIDYDSKNNAYYMNYSGLYGKTATYKRFDFWYGESRHYPPDFHGTERKTNKESIGDRDTFRLLSSMPFITDADKVSLFNTLVKNAPDYDFTINLIGNHKIRCENLYFTEGYYAKGNKTAKQPQNDEVIGYYDPPYNTDPKWGGSDKWIWQGYRCTKCSYTSKTPNSSFIGYTYPTKAYFYSNDESKVKAPDRIYFNFKQSYRLERTCGSWKDGEHRKHTDDRLYNRANEQDDEAFREFSYYNLKEGNKKSFNIFGNGDSWVNFYLQSYHKLEDGNEYLINNDAIVKNRIRWESVGGNGKLIVPMHRTEVYPFTQYFHYDNKNEVLIDRTGKIIKYADVTGEPMPATTKKHLHSYRLNFTLPVQYAGEAGKGRTEDIEFEINYFIYESASNFEFNSVEYNNGTHVEIPGAIRDWDSYNTAKSEFDKVNNIFEDINREGIKVGYNNRL